MHVYANRWKAAPKIIRCSGVPVRKFQVGMVVEVGRSDMRAFAGRRYLPALIPAGKVGGGTSLSFRETRGRALRHSNILSRGHGPRPAVRVHRLRAQQGTATQNTVRDATVNVRLARDASMTGHRTVGSPRRPGRLEGCGQSASMSDVKFVSPGMHTCADIRY